MLFIIIFGGNIIFYEIIHKELDRFFDKEQEINREISTVDIKVSRLEKKIIPSCIIKEPKWTRKQKKH